MADRAAKARPFVLAPHAQRDPTIFPGAAVHAVRQRDRIAISVTRGDRARRGVLEERRGHELKSGFVLREIDRAPVAGASPPLERGEDCDNAVADRDVVDIRAVEDDRGPIALAEELVESREGRELAAVAGVLRVRSGLALVAARKHDQVALRLPHGLDAEPAARERSGREALDDDIGVRDEPERDRRRLRMAQVERRTFLSVVVEREHPRIVRRGLSFEGRVRRAECVERGPALDVDHLGAVVREVFADEGPGGGPTELDDPQTGERGRLVRIAHRGAHRSGPLRRRSGERACLRVRPRPGGDHRDGVRHGRRADARTCAVEKREPARESHATAAEVEVLPEIPRLELRIGEDLGCVGNRIAEHVPGDHAVEEVTLREHREKLADGGLETIHLGLREQPVVERLPIDPADHLVERAARAHPFREHPAGVPADRPALDRERDVAVRAGPDVPELRADDAPPEEKWTEPAMLLAKRLPKHDRRRMDGRHRGLRRDIDVLTATGALACRERDESAHGRVHAGPERRLRERRPYRGAPLFAGEPEAPARGGHLEV